MDINSIPAGGYQVELKRFLKGICKFDSSQNVKRINMLERYISLRKDITTLMQNETTSDESLGYLLRFSNSFCFFLFLFLIEISLLNNQIRMLN